MRIPVSILFCLLAGLFCDAQKSHTDSLREMVKKDSIEYQRQLEEIKNIKLHTDSLIKDEFGNINEPGKKQDSIAMIKNLKALIAQKKEEEERRAKENFYKAALVFLILIVTIIIFFKRKQFAGINTTWRK
jgi:hypothetical protein